MDTSTQPIDSTQTPDFGPVQMSPDQISGLQTDITATQQKESALDSAEQSSATQTFQGQEPQRDLHVLDRLGPLLLLSAFGGHASKLNAGAMLAATSGTVKGYLAGNEQAYQESKAKYDAAYQAFKDHQAQQDKIYQQMREAYKGRIDGDIKALQFAREVTGDQGKIDAQILNIKERQDAAVAKLGEIEKSLDERKAHDQAMEDIARKKLTQQIKESGANITPEAAQLMVQRLMNGEKPADVLGNLGRGKQGAADIAVVQNLFAQEAGKPGADGKPTMSAQDIADRKQELAAEAKTRLELGSREGKIAPRVQEAQIFAQNALTASEKVPRSEWASANKAIQAGETQASDPNMAAFLVYNNSLINAYSAAIGGGVMHVSDTEHARQMLSTAMGPEAYKAAVQALLTETQGALKAPQQVMGGLRNPTPVAPASAPAPGTAAPAQPPTATGPNGEKVQFVNGQWVPMQ